MASGAGEVRRAGRARQTHGDAGGTVNRIRGALDAAGDLWRFTRESRNIAFFLLAIILLGLGVIIVVTENSVIMPFIYSIF